MFEFFKRQILGINKPINSLQEQNNKLLRDSIAELEKFNSQEFPSINKSNAEALKGLEQASNNIKGLMNIK